MLLYGLKFAPAALGAVPQFRVSQFMQLTSVNIADIPPQDGKENAFLIFSNMKSFTVLGDTPEAKIEWMTAIENAIKKNKQTKSDSHGQVAPVWDPDASSDKCSKCNAQFTMFNRRHHCRHCGKIVCGDCSKKQFRLDYSGKSEKVCDTCYKQLTDAVLKNKK